MKSQAERRAFLEDPKLQLVEILDDVLEVECRIDAVELDKDINAAVKAYRAKRGRGKRSSALAHA